MINVLEYIGEHGNDDPQRGEAIELLDVMSHFEFVFVLLFMIKILGITCDLSQVLQRRDEDIINVVHLVKVSKYRMQIIRDDGWEFIFTSYITYNTLLQFQELNNRFDEVNTNLLLCMTYLDPEYLFSAFDVSKLIELAKFYPYEFLQNFGALVKNVVAIKKHIVFPLVYTFVKLSLLLPVATATFEKVFSAMHIIKNRLRNKMGDDLLKDCLVTYIERDVFVNVDNEDTMNRFQIIKNRREIL
ncbi:hypothetical protein MANES_14G154402v8 [Manihot esculenta]|uniref:Uncharacterized protein n=1 Tax=Manihot esculenta TaxID=3983 RepID=A0ACB7GI14_MANES|nr:hypothetical protein MANES_14G154402v8 [Manihot esculenta]